MDGATPGAAATGLIGISSSDRATTSDPPPGRVFPVLAVCSFSSSTKGASLKRLPPLLVGLLAGVASAVPASAHEYWLAPSAYRAHAGDTVRVAAWVGTGFRGELKPYAPTRAVSLVARQAVSEDLRPTSVNGDDVFGRFVLRDAGGAVVAYESNFVPIELDAIAFDQYLELEGLDGPLAYRERLGPREGPGRERYARCPKTWIAGSDPKRLMAPIGLTIELVPLADPTRPGPVSLLLLYRGKPLAGALVRAWRQPLAKDGAPFDGATRDSVGPAAQERTDKDGVATFALDQAGEWMVSAVHMVPCPDHSAADWQSMWASLTFARIETRGKAR